jgi:hypothetical protein
LIDAQNGPGKAKLLKMNRKTLRTWQEMAACGTRETPLFPTSGQWLMPPVRPQIGFAVMRVAAYGTRRDHSQI